MGINWRDKKQNVEARFKVTGVLIGEDEGWMGLGDGRSCIDGQEKLAEP